MTRPVVRQRGDRDCGVAALAMLAGVSYEDAYVAVARVDPHRRGKQGLHNAEIIRAARALDLRLVATRTYDLDEDEGILRVRFRGARAKSSPGGHFVYVVHAEIRDGADTVFPMPWADYCHTSGARPCTLLREVR